MSRRSVLAFHFVDKIVALKKGESISISRVLREDEEYLQDHFAKFPTMPGVLILESAIQAATWLLRYTDSFKYSFYTVKEIKAVKFGQFVRPGDELQVQADLMKEEEGLIQFKAQAILNGASAIRVRFQMERQSIQEENASLKSLHENIVERDQKSFKKLTEEAVFQ